MSQVKQNCNKRILHHIEAEIPKYVQVQWLPQPKGTVEIPEQVSKCAGATQLDSVVSVPKKNATLGMKKRIKKVQGTKPRRVKSLSELSKDEKATADEKIAKKMNFPVNQRLYKELISLEEAEKTELPLKRNCYESILKDEAPRLADFFTPIVGREFKIPVSVQVSPQKVYRKYNGLRTHQMMQSWEDCSTNYS